MKDAPYDPPFLAWIEHIFGSFDRKERWDDDDFDAEDVPPDERVRRLTLLFRGCGALLSKYPDDNVGRGLNYLSNSGLAEYSAAIFKEPPNQARIACVESMGTLYKACWAARCRPEISGDPESRTGPLNISCYMWWELLNYQGDRHLAGRKELDAACLRVMADALEIPHVACQESALHGLNDWTGDYSGEVARIIDLFLHRHPEADEYIRDYAKIARRGRL